MAYYEALIWPQETFFADPECTPQLSDISQRFQTPMGMPFGGNSTGQWPALTQNALPTAPLEYPFIAPAFCAKNTSGFLYPTSVNTSTNGTAQLSSAVSSTKILSLSKPSTSADTETYSCTYQNCTQCFLTPQKLKKHKRDVHRTTPNITPGVGSGMTPAELMERNLQTGPYKCERINPGTGKPCNAIFSRPYDLTRHEDTIHNPNKQKAHYDFYEENTVPCRDALTRHLRVKHPEVDIGEYRRQGGNRYA
jgi:hypothetical protein